MFRSTRRLLNSYNIELARIQSKLYSLTCKVEDSSTYGMSKKLHEIVKNLGDLPARLVKLEERVDFLASCITVPKPPEKKTRRANRR